MNRLNFSKAIGQLFGNAPHLRHRFTGRSAVAKAAKIRFSSLLHADVIKIPLRSTSKKKALWELVELFEHAGKITETDFVYRSVLSREQISSTGVGHGVAIPEGRSTEITEMVCAFGIQPEGIHFGSVDGQPVDIFFLVVAPEHEPEFPLMKLLATLSHILKNETHQRQIRTLTSPQEVLAFFSMLDNDSGDSHRNEQ